MPTEAQKDWSARRAAFERSIRKYSRGRQMVLMLEWERRHPKPAPSSTGSHTFKGHNMQDLRDLTEHD